MTTKQGHEYALRSVQQQILPDTLQITIAFSKFRPALVSFFELELSKNNDITDIQLWMKSTITGD